MSELQFVHLGFGADAVEYGEAWQRQRTVHAARFADEVPDTCLLLEHPPVYTAGRRTADSERPLDGTPVVDVDRGGKITWHGPGQLVGYPILKLPRPVDVVAHVRRLEDALILTAAEFGLETSRVEGRSGVWVLGDPLEQRSRDAAQVAGPDRGTREGHAAEAESRRSATTSTAQARSRDAAQVAGPDRGTRERHAAEAESRRSATTSTAQAPGGLTLDFDPRIADEEFDPRLNGPEYAPSNAGQRREDRKLAAIGIRVAKGVTMHGFALNCNPDTTWFDRIVPCGIRDAGVTSLSEELGRDIGVAEVLPVVTKHLGAVLAAAVPLPRAV